MRDTGVLCDLSRETHPRRPRPSSQMRHWSFTLICALSLLVCLGALGLWLRSYRYWDSLCRQTASGRLWGAMSIRGQIRLDVTTGWPHEPGPWQFGATPLQQNGLTFSLAEPNRWHLCGFGYDDRSIAWRVSFHEHAEPRQLSGRFQAVIMPHWFVSALAAILPAIWCRRFLLGWRRRRRIRRGLCANCGYDLRATPHQRPECGSVAQPPG